jgi:hypothetical protein
MNKIPIGSSSLHIKFFMSSVPSSSADCHLCSRFSTATHSVINAYGVAPGIAIIQARNCQEFFASMCLEFVIGLHRDFF